jgi:hypothetical protein
MRVPRAPQAQASLGHRDRGILTARVDEVARRIGPRVTRGVVEGLDRQRPRHGNPRRVRWGGTAVIGRASLRPAGDPRKVSVDASLTGRHPPWSHRTGQRLEPLEGRMTGAVRAAPTCVSPRLGRRSPRTARPAAEQSRPCPRTGAAGRRRRWRGITTGPTGGGGRVGTAQMSRRGRSATGCEGRASPWAGRGRRRCGRGNAPLRAGTAAQRADRPGSSDLVSAGGAAPGGREPPSRPAPRAPWSRSPRAGRARLPRPRRTGSPRASGRTGPARGAGVPAALTASPRGWRPPGMRSSGGVVGRRERAGPRQGAHGSWGGARPGLRRRRPPGANRVWPRRRPRARPGRPRVV